MEFGNKTFLTEIILIGFPQNLQICILLFVFFFLMYILTIVGNGFLICIIIISPQLHTPMYYFICNLSLLDLCFSSSSLPKVLLDLFSKRRTISVIGCLAQVKIGFFLGSTESILLAVMAYDRYIAIRFPLHYTINMNWKTCRIITVIMWSGSYILASIPTLKPLVFCTDNILDHFVCEILAVVELECGDVIFHKITLFAISLFILVTPVVFIVVSYICIIRSILKIRSAGGRSRAFSTCASHLIVVFMFYGATISVYMGQAKSLISNLKYISIMYGVMTPVLNPMIYSLRNNEVKEAFRKILTKYSASRTA